MQVAGQLAAALHKAVYDSELDQRKETKTMKRTYLVVLAMSAVLPFGARAQADKPGAVAAAAVEGIVTVQSVNYEMRTVTVQGPRGKLVTLNVPPEAQNLDQVHPGSKFKVTYLESVAVFISPTGGEPAAGEGTALQLAEKGATPGGVIVNVRQIQARVDQIDYGTRHVVLTGPDGNQVEVTVDDSVQRLDEVKPGDLVVVRYTEALAMRMLKQ